MEPKKSPEQIRIKTLEEIKQEKAAKSQSQSQNDGSLVVTPETTNIATTAVKRSVTVKENAIGHVKTFNEVLRSKKKRQEEPGSSPKRAKHSMEIQGESNVPGPEATTVGKVRVKTLEEIRREKAARVQAQQVVETESRSSDSEDDGAKKRRLLRINKLPVDSKKALVCYCVLLWDAYEELLFWRFNTVWNV